MQEKLSQYFIEPGQEYEIDLFRPEDAEGVVNLFLMVYGRNYPIRTFIEPELLISENAANRTISSVARTRKGDIVGHNALFCSAPYQGIRESGSGLVHPLYRGGKGIFAQMCGHGVQIAAQKLGSDAVFGESVCNHVFSQKMTHGLGAESMALEVDLMPASAYEKEKSAGSRVASFMDIIILKQKPHLAYLPPAYEISLRYLYEGLKDERFFEVSQGAVPEEISTEIVVQVFDFAQVARLAVRQAGRDFVNVFGKEEEGATRRGVEVIQVWVPLTWPWVGEIVRNLRERGYFLGGILPRWFDGDGLLMQKILHRPSWEHIQIHFDRGRKIMETIREDWSEVSGNS